MGGENEGRTIEVCEENDTDEESPKVVGVAFSEKFLLHKSKKGGHVERPNRLVSIVNALQGSGIWNELEEVVVRPATTEELLLVHTERYVGRMNKLDSLCTEKGKEVDCEEALEEWNSNCEDVYFNEHTVACAKHAVGGCIEATRSVVSGCLNSAVALVRPPGHHSESHCAQGFCVFNNVAISAMYALETLGLKRVLIVDWDIHHGNGTQNAFLEDPRVMYFSTHRFDFGKFYPSQQVASPMTVGKGLAAGTNINVAWNGKGMGDAEYLAAWDKVLLPIAKQFDPQLVIVSAGFDAAEGDAMGECLVTPNGYAVLTNQLQVLAGGRIVLMLEGGYHLPSLSLSLTACVEQLIGKRTDESRAFEEALRLQSVKESALESIKETLRAQKAYWVL